MSTGVRLVLFFVSIGVTALINSIEISVIAAPRLRVRHLAEEGNRPAQALDRLQRGQEKFLAAMVFLQMAMVVLAAAAGAEIGQDIADKVGISGVVAFALSTIIVAFIEAEFGDLIPKVLAARASERYALFVAVPTEAIIRVLSVFLGILEFLPSWLARRLFGVDLGLSETVSEAELRRYIGISAESGSVPEEEAELLDRVFHFGDRRVHEVMVPRTEVVWLVAGATVSEFYATFRERPHSRFPVYEGNPDTVVGVVGIKDVLKGLATGELSESSPLDSVIRPAYFVPESKLVGELFREMQATGAQMAIGIDEYGGTAGIVTLEQLLEEMVGTVRDELAPAEEEIQQIDERTTEIDGALSVVEARDELGLDIPDGPYDTVAGFVLSELGHIPREGESVAVDGARVTVIEMKGAKIERLRVRRP